MISINSHSELHMRRKQICFSLFHYGPKDFWFCAAVAFYCKKPNYNN